MIKLEIQENPLRHYLHGKIKYKEDEFLVGENSSVTSKTVIINPNVTLSDALMSKSTRASTSFYAMVSRRSRDHESRIVRWKKWRRSISKLFKELPTLWRFGLIILFLLLVLMRILTLSRDQESSTKWCGVAFQAMRKFTRDALHSQPALAQNVKELLEKINILN